LFKFSNNIIVKTFRQIRELLPSHLKKNAFWVFILLLISSVLEVLGLALLIPLFTIVVDFDAISKIKFLSQIYESLGFESQKLFSVFLAFIIGVVFLIKNVFLMFVVHHQVKFSFKLFNFYSTKSLEYYFSQGYEKLKSSDANTILRNIAFIPKVFNRSYVINYLNLLNDIFVISIIILALLIKNALLVIVLFSVLLPFVLIFYFLVRRRIKHYENFDLAIQPKITRTIFQVVYGYLDTLVNRAFYKIAKRNNDFIEQSSDNGVKMLTLKAMPAKMVELAMVFSFISMVAFGLYYFDETSELVSALAFFGIAAFRIMPSINRMLMAVVTITGYDYVYDFLKPVSDFAKKQQNTKSYNTYLIV
jgi:ATP-binding cassette, subfamily B, bacterial PglK